MLVGTILAYLVSIFCLRYNILLIKDAVSNKQSGMILASLLKGALMKKFTVDLVVGSIFLAALLYGLFYSWDILSYRYSINDKAALNVYIIISFSLYTYLLVSFIIYMFEENIDEIE